MSPAYYFHSHMVPFTVPSSSAFYSKTPIVSLEMTFAHHRKKSQRKLTLCLFLSVLTFSRYSFRSMLLFRCVLVIITPSPSAYRCDHRLECQIRNRIETSIPWIVQIGIWQPLSTVFLLQHPVFFYFPFALRITTNRQRCRRKTILLVKMLYSMEKLVLFMDNFCRNPKEATWNAKCPLMDILLT